MDILAFHRNFSKKDTILDTGKGWIGAEQESNNPFLLVSHSMR